MSQLPHELIRQVQISTRAAAGLPDYDPSDPTLPSLPPLSAAIAASDQSLPYLRCRNCKGMLLRGTESIICLYCGFGPHYDAVPEPICFTSTIGYQWLLRSLRLDGSEIVDLSDKKEGDLGHSSPKSVTRLSEILNFKIQWATESEKQETSSDTHSEENKRSLSLTGVPPDRFFLNSKKNGLSDMPIEQPSDRNQIGREDVAALGNQDLFQNVRLSEPAVISSEHKDSDALSGWAADFQSADSENQHVGHESFEPAAGLSAVGEIIFQDHSSSGLEVDLGAEIDSVFGPGNLNDGEPKEHPDVSLDNTLECPIDAFENWNSDELNILSFRGPSYTSFDSTFSTKNDPQNDSTLEYPKDDSTTDDLFQDFQFQTNYTDMTNNKTMNEEHRATNEDFFEWNDFTGSTSSQVPPENDRPRADDQVSTSAEKSSEMDLFSFDNKFEGDDFGSFSQSNFFPTSTSNSNAPTEGSAIACESPASNWLSETSSPALESAKAANNEDASAQSSQDDVKMLISQMHDLSFMLETDLSIPSGPDAPPDSSAKD